MVIWSRSAAVACLALLCFASTGLGDIILGDWESTLEDWAVVDTNFAATPGMTPGATLHSHSLGISAATDKADGWKEVIQKSWGGWWQLTPFQNETTVSVDVTVIASEWALDSNDGNDWGIKPIENLVVAGPSNWWEQLTPNTIPDFSGDSNRPGVWKPVDGDTTFTYTFTVPGRGSDMFVNLVFITNRGTVNTVGNIYLDNARIITPPMLITKCAVTAGKTQYTDNNDFNDMKDTFSASGTVNLPADINTISSVGVEIASVTDIHTVYSETLSDFNAAVVNAKGKYTHTAKVIKGQEGKITSLKIDFRKGTFNLAGKNLDLTGLSCPLQLRFIMDTNTYNGNASETVVNGKKLIPTRLMRLYGDKLVVTKAKAKHNATKPSADTLTIKGEIAVADMNIVANEPNLFEVDVNLIWGDVNDFNNAHTFTIPAGSFTASKKGHIYKCKKVNPDVTPVEDADTNTLVAATIDLDKCTFTASISKANNIYAEKLGTAVFGIRFDTETGDFNEVNNCTLP
jgi:hypothetical protein